MYTNESMMDRWVRAIIGIILLYVAYAMLMGWMQTIVYVVGIVLIVTAITGFCLLYKLIGVNTKK